MKSHISFLHFGVYGIAISSKQQILVITKATGPYKGKFDLPGGGLETDELMLDSLQREFLEETGLKIQACWQLRTFDTLFECNYWLDEKETRPCWFRHIGVIYQVQVEEKSPKAEPDGDDSLGAQWLDIKKINQQNSSNFLWQAIKL